METSELIAIIIASAALLGVALTYFKLVLGIEHRIANLRTDIEHRLTKVETIFEFIPFSRLLDLMQTMLEKIPSASPTNPYDRRGELMAKLQRQELTHQEAIELRDLVTRDVEKSGQDEFVKALILIGLGILIGYVLLKK